MTQKDIEKLNAYVSTEVSKYNDFMNVNPLEIYLVSSNNEKMGLNLPIKQIGLNEFCGLYNKINEPSEIHTQNEAIDMLKDYGWASFVGNDKINYIFLSDPELTNKNDKDKDIKEPLTCIIHSRCSHFPMSGPECLGFSRIHTDLSAKTV